MKKPCWSTAKTIHALILFVLSLSPSQITCSKPGDKTTHPSSVITTKPKKLTFPSLVHSTVQAIREQSINQEVLARKIKACERKTYYSELAYLDAIMIIKNQESQARTSCTEGFVERTTQALLATMIKRRNTITEEFQNNLKKTPIICDTGQLKTAYEKESRDEPQEIRTSNPEPLKRALNHIASIRKTRSNLPGIPPQEPLTKILPLPTSPKRTTKLPAIKVQNTLSIE